MLWLNVFLLLLLHKTAASQVADPLELSDAPHQNEKGEHTAEYDHEAFLGKKDAKRFLYLSEEEAKWELGFLFTKVDGNRDDSISEQELIEWMKRVQRDERMTDVNDLWKSRKLGENDSITFRQYNEFFYDSPSDDLEQASREEFLKHQKLLKRRWEGAAKSKDGKLTKSGFLMFLNPEDFREMQVVFVQEWMAEMDKNEDGFIQKAEYFSEYDSTDQVSLENDFSKLDKDNDGMLDVKEVQDWIIPEHKYEEEEAKHLIETSDKNQDGKLSKDEMLNNWSLFVGSRVTNKGDLKATLHTEL